MSRIPNSMEVWWIGANGSVQGAWPDEGGQWGLYELAPAGSASPNGGITAESRIPNSIEVWGLEQTAQCKMLTGTAKRSLRTSRMT
ncbi:hypothetical protein [Bacillus thuringiensis]|uniref:hypothetical protein n=1 Tax=Bacillus cereus group TaxID=86661 RepID=UPI00140FDA4C|nr:hypothetical protein [Bacillus thuringiensis]MCH5449175.1 hypothetical protein [Bacillus cereus]MCU5187317.1 hypothetical protein [Bacillus cereus]